MLLKTHINLDLNTMLGHLEKQISQKYQVRFMFDPESKNKIGPALFKIKQKWKNSHQTVENFIKSNEDWVSTNITFKVRIFLIPQNKIYSESIYFRIPISQSLRGFMASLLWSEVL